MPAIVRHRLTWPLLAAVALAGAVAGTRLTLSEPLPSLVAVLMTVFGTALLIALPGFASLALLAPRALTPATRLGALLSVSGVAAYLEFWTWVASPTLGRATAVALLVASVGVLARTRPNPLLDVRPLWPPFGILLLVVLAYLGLAYSQGGLGGVHWIGGAPAGDTTAAMAYRYWLAPDNTIPLLFAERIASHGSLTVPILDSWHTSDRPPLQTGFMLMLYPLFGHKSFAYQLLGTVLQALWIPALWILLRSRGVTMARVLVVVICTAATGASLVNTVYVWPKMLAGAFALAAIAVVLEGGSLILVALLAALALLSHGGVAFSLLALAPLVWRMRPGRSKMGIGVAAGAVLYLPWIAYQRFLDPPGDRLLKWQLAGVLRPDRHSFLHDLVEQYMHDPFRTFLVDKLLNVERLVVVPTILRQTDTATYTSFLGSSRAVGVTSLLPAIGPILIGVAGLAAVAVRRALRPMRSLFVFLVLSVLCWVILEFGGSDVTGTTVHQGPYAVLVLATALAALTTTYLPRPAAITIICAGLVLFGLEWLPGLGFQPAQHGLAAKTDWEMIGLGVGSVVVLGLTLFRTMEPNDHEQGGMARQDRRQMVVPSLRSVARKVFQA